MAIPATPQGFFAQTGNQENYVSWNLSPGATTYTVQRSTDQITYSTIASPVVTNYLDDAVTLGVQYFYKVRANNSDGSSPYTLAQSVIPVPTSEMCLGQLRLHAQQRADRVGSNFVTLPEWTTFINLAMYELYDLILKQDGDFNMAPPVTFSTNGNANQYPLPNGVLEFTDENGDAVVAAPFYKLKGVDLALGNGNLPNNGFVSINKFNFSDRNKYIYPNTNSTLYGIFNMRYRLIGANIMLQPAPSANQVVRLWYNPRLPQLLKDTDITTIGVSGWLDYVIVRAAKYALDKEESDTSKLDAELGFLQKRIEAMSDDRDAGLPDTISDVTGAFGGGNGGWGPGASGPVGGF